MRTQQKKGKAYELEVAGELRCLFPAAKRGAAQARNGRREEDGKADVEETPYWVECCHGARPNIFEKLAQAREATDGRLCVTVVKKNRGESVASMYLSDFLLMLRDIEILRAIRSRHPELVADVEARRAAGDTP